ncbi:MAG: tryptophan-rich sensory protein [Clostridia bacterium]|nr:tryptophan-rich sensory protein [Clostridia bacterium]
MKKLKPYIISVLIALLVGGLSALLTMGNMNIYNEINTPSFAPPGILFPIVWSVLYILMGISAGLIKTSENSTKDERLRALFTYGISLFVNFLWSIIFFNMRFYLLAFVWLVLLWVLILKTIWDYSKINKLAAYLQIPYLLWVTFAGILNFSIYLLN